MLCASWAWGDKGKVNSISLLDFPDMFQEDHTNDYFVIDTLHKVLSQADAIIAHNGDNFDLKKFNARAIYHGLDPIPNLVQIDTLKMARSKFKFTYNRLDYLGRFLGVGHKLKTDVDLWLDCLNGDEKALKKMVSYNKVDVVMLRKVYQKLAPWCPSKLNQNHFTEGRVCPSCGGKHLVKHKRRLTRAGAMVQVQCQTCGHYSSYPESKSGVEGLIR